MEDGMQIYKFDNMTIYQQHFFDMTRLNFMYDRRCLYSKKNKKWEYNSYFPFDMVKEKLKFYGLYLSAYANFDLVSIDSDFDIGFNNIEYNIEKEIVNMLENEFNEMEVIIKITNSYEHKDIIHKVRSQYNVLYNLGNIYIIRIDDIKKLDFINKYIFGFLFEGKDFPILFKQNSINIADLKFIQKLIEQFTLVMLKVPLFANYNMMLYSKQKKIIEIINKRILALRCKEINIENIENINNSKNLLLFNSAFSPIK